MIPDGMIGDMLCYGLAQEAAAEKQRLAEARRAAAEEERKVSGSRSVSAEVCAVQTLKEAATLCTVCK